MQHQLWLNGTRTMGTPQELRAPGSGQLLGQVHFASARQVEAAIGGMVEAFGQLRRWSSHQRQQACAVVHRRLAERAEEFARTIALEAGKPIRTARGEVARAVTTFQLAVEESTRIVGEQLPVDIDARSQGYHAVVERVPVGPCSFITPFNFPLNLVAHKVAPALAAGCPFVIKPAERTPLTALLLGELLAEAGLPAGAFSVLPCERSVAAPLVTDDRIELLSFTGSPEVGWKMKAEAGRKAVVLELGNNSAVIVEPDADVADAAARMVTGAFGYAGQSCISVQRIFLHEAVADDVQARLIAGAAALRVGDVLDEATDVGPMVDEAAAKRAESWIAEAVGRGARVLIGGTREGAYLAPTLLENVPADAKLACQEVFAPVAVIIRYTDFADALRQVNATAYGLQAGVFTRDLFKARQAFETLDVAGVIINDVPTMRIDNMPYGGMKTSGHGREGVRYAIEHFTQRKVLVTRYG